MLRPAEAVRIHLLQELERSTGAAVGHGKLQPPRTADDLPELHHGHVVISRDHPQPLAGQRPDHDEVLRGFDIVERPPGQYVELDKTKRPGIGENLWRQRLGFRLWTGVLALDVANIDLASARRKQSHDGHCPDAPPFGFFCCPIQNTSEFRTVYYRYGL